MGFFEILKVIFLGIVEGITEWLPISSTGHLILVNQFLKLDVSSEFLTMFNVVIQLGAIIAVLVLFWKKLWPFSTKKEDYYMKIPTMRLWVKVLIALVPTILLGLPLNDWLDEQQTPFIVSIMLIVYGVLFIIIENMHANKKPGIKSISQLTYKTALFIGLFQALSMIPGTSRSGATILGAIILGCSRGFAAEFSFFMAVPTMFGASLLKIVKFGFDFTATEVVYLLLGMVVAFVVSYFAIKFLMDFVKRHDFKAFGYYRIILGILVLGYFLFAGGLFNQA